MKKSNNTFDFFETEEDWKQFKSDIATELVDEYLSGGDDDYEFVEQIYRNGDIYVRISYERCRYNRIIHYGWIHATRVYPKQVMQTIYVEEL
jgi:hypothetical protein